MNTLKVDFTLKGNCWVRILGSFHSVLSRQLTTRYESLRALIKTDSSFYAPSSCSVLFILTGKYAAECKDILQSIWLALHNSFAHVDFCSPVCAITSGLSNSLLPKPSHKQCSVGLELKEDLQR